MLKCNLTRASSEILKLIRLSPSCLEKKKRKFMTPFRLVYLNCVIATLPHPYSFLILRRVIAFLTSPAIVLCKEVHLVIQCVLARDTAMSHLLTAEVGVP